MEGHIGRRFAMAMENPNSPSPATRSNIATSCNVPNEFERLRISEFEPAGSAARSAIDFVGGAPPRRLLDAVEDQRMHLLSVLAIVRSMGATFADATGDPAPEICAAFALLEQAIQRVAAGLEERSLRNAM
jgi:hypothetical protein